MSTEQPVPETRYAEADGLSIAYQVFGSGVTDLVIERVWSDRGSKRPRGRDQSCNSLRTTVGEAYSRPTRVRTRK